RIQPERTFYVGSHPCQAYRKTSSNGWAWGLLSMGNLKFRQLESDGANGEISWYCFSKCLILVRKISSSLSGCHVPALLAICPAFLTRNSIIAWSNTSRSLSKSKAFETRSTA